MKKVVLHIDSAGEHREVTLKDEISIGRTDSADIVLPDSGLSRVNTTFFREDDDVFVVDEDSTNGTFLNGEEISGSPYQVANGDRVNAGNETMIQIEISAGRPEKAIPQTKKEPTSAPKKTKKPAKPKTQSNQLPIIPIIIGSSLFLLTFFVLAVILVISLLDSSTPEPSKQTTSAINTGLLIPVRVIDPLGGEEPDDIQALAEMLDEDIADEVKDSSIFEEVKTDIVDGNADKKEGGLNLNVPISAWDDARRLAMGPRPEPTGTDPPGQVIPPEIAGGGGVPKQKAKLAEMTASGYQQPMDFSDLAQKRLNGDLLELPMATQTYFLDVGESATNQEFTGFDFSRYKTSLSDCYFSITPDSPKYKPLAELAQKLNYDLGNPNHRKQIRIRLLRMFNPKALPILQELANAYYNEFKRPLRVTSLTRSMDYQISLNKGNANSFKVRGPGSLPPHTSGCAFDLSRKQMTAKEQNFVMAKLAEMERRGILDGLREGGANACFHTFIYFDGKPPKGF